MKRPERLFWHKMSRQYGILVDELQEKVDAEQFAEYLAFHRHISPLPDSWTETAVGAATVARVNGNKVKASDFIPIVKLKRQPEMSDDAMWAAVVAGVAASKKYHEQKRARKNG